MKTAAITVNGFRFTGTTTLSTSSGPVDVIEFTLASTANIQQLASVVPCRDAGGGAGLKMIAVSEAARGSTGAIDLFATELKYTDAGGAQDWTVANPPPGPPPVALDADGTALTALDATAVTVSIATLTTSSHRTYAAFCAGTAASPARPAGSPPPPTPPPPTPSPLPEPSPSGSPPLQPSPVTSGPAPSPSPPPIEVSPAPTVSPGF